MRPQLFDVDRERHEKRRDELSSSEIEQLIEDYSEHRERFEREFENLPETREEILDDDKHVPRHPYKVFQEIRKSREDMETEEYMVLVILKERYGERWRDYREAIQE